MKNKIVVLGLMLMASMAVDAQESIYRRLDNYYDNKWTWDTCQNYESYAHATWQIMVPTRYGLFKRTIFEEKSYTVYGVAICTQVDTCFCRTTYVTPDWQNNVAYPVADSVYLKVQMRRYDNGAMTLMAETILHPLDSVPRYYLRNVEANPDGAPIYEAYFPEGITVSEDTMYVGFFIPQPERRVVYNDFYVMNWRTWPITFVSIVRSNAVDTTTRGMYLFMDTIGGEWEKHGLYGRDSYTYMFPIIAPYSPHTPQPPQQGVEENREEVQVLLSPNPATHVAGVSASAVIERLEVYNAAGVKVYEGSPDYVIATLDVSRWASGVYLLKVHTAAGSVTKKLTVKH